MSDECICIEDMLSLDVYDFLKRRRTSAHVLSACLCQLTFIVMHLGTQHRPDICAAQRAAIPGIVRT